jgi:hypothetical protein
MEKTLRIALISVGILFVTCTLLGQTEIIPFIDKSYKTNSDRGIAGHSLGGLFTACIARNGMGTEIW